MIDLLPDPPDPATDAPSVFSAKAAASVLAQKVMVAQFNDALGQFNASLAGGAYALPYVFDAATADGDPGPGKLRLSSTTQNAATVLRLDVLAGGQDVSSVLDKFDASTSDVKGSIRLVKVGDPSKWLTFDVMARAAPSGYRNLTVVNTGGSSASPFAAPDGVLLFFQRNGDIGMGLSATSLIANVSITSTVSAVNMLNVFTSQYDHYLIEGELFAAQANIPMLRLAVAGAAVNNGYTPLTAGPTSQYSAANQPQFNLGGQNAATDGSIAFSIEVVNTNGASNRPKLARVSAGYRDTPSGYYNVSNGVGGFFGAGPLTGFQLLLSAGSFSSGTVRVYGFKNS